MKHKINKLGLQTGLECVERGPQAHPPGSSAARAVQAAAWGGLWGQKKSPELRLVWPTCC